MISKYKCKINPVTAANEFNNSLVRTPETSSDTDLFDIIVLDLFKNVKCLVFKFHHNLIVSINIFIILLYILIRKRYFLGIGPSCEYLF